MTEALKLFASSHSMLLACMGVSAMIGMLHLWMVRGRGDANSWIAAWAGLAFLHLVARGVQVTTDDPAAALTAGKATLAVGPFLVWAVVGFTSNLHAHDHTSRFALRLLGGLSVGWAVAIFATSWFVEPTVTTRSDPFGATHYSVHTRWPTLLLATYIVAVFVWGIRRLRRAGRLEPMERRVLVTGFGLYGLLGVGALLSGLGVIPLPAMAEYGPFMVGVCLSYLLVHRRRVLERKLLERVDVQTSRLVASEERYRDLVEHAPLGVFACDLSGAVTTMNQRMAELFAEIAPGSGIANIFAAPAAKTGLSKAVWEALDRDEAVCHDARCSTPEAQALDLRITATPLRDEGGRASGALVLSEDVTERNQLERQLRQAQKMESVGQLASGIAHEINNPMAYVRSNLAAVSEGTDALHKELRDTPLSESAKERLADLETLVEESREGVERTIAIVRDVREFTHAGDEEHREIELAELLAICVRFASVFAAEGVSIHEDYGSGLRVRGVQGPLRQVFHNLLVNALHAVGMQGRILVEARRGEHSVCVRVHDDGPGVPEEARSRLFDPFFTTKSVGEGTGLGLYISYQIVEHHGGTIQVERSPMGGALFEVELPVVGSAKAQI